MVYPETLPVNAVTILLQAAMKPGEIKTANMVAACYELLGYILGQMVGQPVNIVGGDLKDILEKINASQATSVGG